MSQLIGTASNQVPTNGDLGSAAFMDSSAFYGTGMSASFRNRIINGDMRVDQRLAGTQGTYVYNAPQESKYGVDRWSTTFFSFTSGAGNMAYLQSVADAPAGFMKSLKITSISGFTAGGANSGIGGFITQSIEGQNIADFALPSGGFCAMVLSLWVKASKVGTVSISVESNATGGCHWLSTVTINAANTWEYKVVHIPASSFGAINKDTTAGLVVNIGLTSNGSWLVNTPNQWNTDANRGVLAPNQTQFMSGAGDTFQLTGVQLEKGTQATPFEHRPIGTELALCQRYFVKETQGNAYKAILCSTGYPRTYYMVVDLPIPMRSTPTYTTSETDIHKPGVRFDGIASKSVSASGNRSFMVEYTVNNTDTGLYVAQPRDFTYSATAEI